MFTVNIIGESNTKNTQLVKLTLVLYKPGYPRVKRVLDYTGLTKDWDNNAQMFKSSKGEAINSTLMNLKLDYKNKAREWDEEERNWSPVELARYFDTKSTGQKKTKKAKENQIKSMPVQNIIDVIIKENNNKKRIKNGKLINSSSNGKLYLTLKNSLIRFVENTYNRSFANYYFTDITEDFLLDYVVYIKKETDERFRKKKKKKVPTYGGLTTKLRKFRAVCNRALKENIKGANISFDCVASYILYPEFEPKAVSVEVMNKISNIDRSRFTEFEDICLDLFLWSWYVGGMPNADVCALTWDNIDYKKNLVVYERIKINRTAKPPLPKKGKEILKKYRGKGYENYVFPVYTEYHDTTEKQNARESYFSGEVSKTLTMICKILKIKEDITWYTARSSYITMLVDKGYNPYLIGEITGTSPLTIYKNYYKNTKQKEVIQDLNDTFE